MIQIGTAGRIGPTYSTKNEVSARSSFCIAVMLLGSGNRKSLLVVDLLISIDERQMRPCQALSKKKKKKEKGLHTKFTYPAVLMKSGNINDIL